MTRCELVDEPYINRYTVLLAILRLFVLTQYRGDVTDRQTELPQLIQRTALRRAVKRMNQNRQIRAPWSIVVHGTTVPCGFLSKTARVSLWYMAYGDCIVQQLCAAYRQYHNGLSAAKRMLAELQANHRFVTFIQVCQQSVLLQIFVSPPPKHLAQEAFCFRVCPSMSLCVSKT